MPATVRSASSFNAAALTREAATPAVPRPTVASGGSSRIGVVSERDLIADLEPHWAAAIDAATD